MAVPSRDVTAPPELCSPLHYCAKSASSTFFLVTNACLYLIRDFLGEI
jgi:hypothetical protein